ncbi:MAG TPA: hypothetical protein DEQ83_09235 [Rhodobiaceae bacterium]|nr:hypothetical protein [Rhodobiaceae bacterium]
MFYAIVTLLPGFFLVLWAHDALLRRRIAMTLPKTGAFISVPSAHLHYLEAGADKKSDDRPSVILLHGSSGSSYDMMETLGRKLASHCHVLSFDRPGIAHSRNRISNHAMSDPRRQAEAIYEAVAGLGLKNPIVIGHSWGGAVATAYAMQYGRTLTAALALGAPLYPWRGRGSWYERLTTTPLIGTIFAHTVLTKYGLGRLEPGVRGNFAPEKPLPDYAARTGLGLILRPRPFVANSVYSLRLSAHLADMRRDYKTLNAPLLLLSGDSDQTVSAQIHSERLHGENPNTCLVIWRGAGHMVQHTRVQEIAVIVTRLADGEPVQIGRFIDTYGAPN